MTNNGHISKGDWIRGALERYEAPLISYAARITGDLERARDIVQDTFLKLCEQERGKVEGHLGEWLFTVCRHRALDVQRKEKRMRPLVEDELEHWPCPEPTPDRLAEQHEASSELLGLLEHLPRRQQEIVRLRFQSGLSYSEISRVTHLTATNVGFILHTALRVLRKQLLSLRQAEAARQLR